MKQGHIFEVELTGLVDKLNAGSWGEKQSGRLLGFEWMVVI